MNTRSRKAKGRRAQQYVRDEIRKYLAPKGIFAEDVTCTLMGESGVDIKLSPAAQKVFPYDTEVKCQESLNIWSALAQAEENAKPGRIPLLVFKRNNSEVYACVQLKYLLQ